MTERDLFVEVKRDGTPIDVEGWACASIDEAMHRSTMVVAKCQLQRYIPAPTWRPIAEMMRRNWTQGDYALGHIAGRGRVVLCWSGTGWYDEMAHWQEPDMLLDLTIPEVPRG